LRFVQLYTSKSFENHRSDLLNPSPTNLQEHKLSPRLVNAISTTAQVVWANSKVHHQGLAGRSDVVLQTAVGMPVAVDHSGNMCVVVMFSPMNIPSTDDALEFLRCIGKGAVSPSIPCLRPVFDANHHMKLPSADSGDAGTNANTNALTLLGDGVNARFVSMASHELAQAPQDTFGIPLLPDDEDFVLDAFDEASYGVWATIMEGLLEEDVPSATDAFPVVQDVTESLEALVLAPQIPQAFHFHERQKERLEEFCHAFLGMSVFDLAEVWVPVGESHPDALRLGLAVLTEEENPSLQDFCYYSSDKMIKLWSGAIGRAYSSGNPVWSTSHHIYADPARAQALEKAKIRTVLAVPVLTGKLTVCVVSFYALVETGSVPFVLRFVQQALRLLWDGLHVVEEPNVKPSIWNDVQPADLGEMAADIEMQHHFMSKKRPRAQISQPIQRPPTNQSTTFQSNNNNKLSVLTHSPALTSVSPSGSLTPILQSLDVSVVQNHLDDAISSIQHAVPFEDMPPSKRAHMSDLPGKPLSMPHCLPTHIMKAQQYQPKPVNPMPVFSAQSLEPTPLAEMPLPPAAIPSSMPTTNMATPKLCKIQGCPQPAVSRKPHCVRHSGSSRLCEKEGCTKCAQGSTRFCIAHGGGRRCTHPGCDKGARDKFFCAAHGGGKRCSLPTCNKSAVGGSNFCTAHGGGKRCEAEGCRKSAQSSTRYCVKHGGGKKCVFAGCVKVARGRTSYCASHGGGVRCKLHGCNRVAIGKQQLCRAHGGASTRGVRTEESPEAPLVCMPIEEAQQQPPQGIQINYV